MSATESDVLSGSLKELMMNDHKDEQRERAENVAAIRRAMAQAEHGEAISLEEAEIRLRRKHGFLACAAGVADS